MMELISMPDSAATDEPAASGSFASVSLPPAPDPEGLTRMGTAAIRRCFLLENLFAQDRVTLVHSEIDRATIGGAVPGSGPLVLQAPSEFRGNFFAQRRELGVFNIGGPGLVRVDDIAYRLATRDAIVIHCLGEPAESRHILVRNRQAVIAPSRSLHFGAGTQRYSFIWAMGGENREFSDMDAVPM